MAPMHIVLGVVGASAGRGARILRTAEADENKLRTRILGLAGAPPVVAGGVTPPTPSGTCFRVVFLEGEAADWDRQLNDAYALGYELVDIIDYRAVFRR
jgi:hypothetical protein